ncbi:MAG: TolC family protein [Saprospiraceae bacterium]|nr:TolC family protein [Pyrinomonadaceae bacterium]
MKIRRYSFLLVLTLFALGLAGNAGGQELQVAKNIPDSPAAVANEPSKEENPAAVSARPDLSRVGVQVGNMIPLTVNDAIRKALENNNSIEITRDDVRFQETSIRSLLGFYDPVFSVSPTFTRNSTTGSAATNDFIVNSNMTHFLKAGGGDYQVFFNNTRTENAFSQAQVSSGSLISAGTAAIYSSRAGIQYTQPLFRNFGIDNTRRNIKIARRRLEQTDADFRRQTIDTIAQVQRTYWDLVFALRDQQNQVANVNLAQENLRQIEARIKAGASAPLARAEVATELANRESSLLLSTQQVSITENNLKQLLLRDAISAEWSQSYVPTDKPAFTLDPVNLDAAVKDAMDNRYELRRLKLASDINAVDISYFKNQTKPQIDLVTTFSLDGLARGGTNSAFQTNLYNSVGDLRFFDAINEIRARPAVGLPPILNDTIIIPAQPSFLFGGFNRSLANIFRSDAPNYSVGVTFSFPLRNRTAKANLAGAQVTQNQIATQTRAQEQVVIVEVRNAVQGVETARQRVLTSRRARENAEIQLDGERKLFESGKSTTFLLFQRENALTNARNAEIRAETDYNKAIADLQRATSTTFQLNNIDVESPTDDK